MKFGLFNLMTMRERAEGGKERLSARGRGRGLHREGKAA